MLASFWLSTWWRHQMEAYSALLAICAGNSPHKGQWRGAFMFSLICAWINRWVNNREAGDLRRYRPHYDVIVMYNNKTKLSQHKHLTRWGQDKMVDIQVHSLERKYMNFDYHFTDFCSKGSNKQYFSIDSYNGLAPTRRQAIIWTNDGKFTDAYMHHSSSMSWSHPFFRSDLPQSWPVTRDCLHILRAQVTQFSGRFMQTTVECRYNAVQYITVLHSLQRLMQNINQSLDPQNTPHISP